MRNSIWAVIVTWRTPTLTSIQLQYLVLLWPEDVHIVLVACSSEAQGLIEDLPLRITALTPEKNLGYAGGNNLGIRFALDHGADYVLVLNSDAFPLPGSLDCLVESLTSEPKIGACGATLLRWDSKGVLEVNSGTGFDWKRGKTYPAYNASNSSVDFPCGAMVLYRADALKMVGLFDSNLFLFYEEIDWCERARSTGFVASVDHGAKALHLGSVSVALAPKAITFYRTRNRIWVLRRYGNLHGCPVRPIRLVAHGFKLLVASLLRGQFGLLWPTFKGLFAGLGRVPTVDESLEIAATGAQFEADVDRSLS